MEKRPNEDPGKEDVSPEDLDSLAEDFEDQADDQENQYVCGNCKLVYDHEDTGDSVSCPDCGYVVDDDEERPKGDKFFWEE